MSKNKINKLLKIILATLIIIPIIFIKDFYIHFHAYLTGNILNTLIREQWHIVLVSILMFIAFLIPLTYRRKANWLEHGLVVAFFVSLFFEMYGIPLTILFASKYLFTQTSTTELPKNIIEFNALSTTFAMDIPMTYAIVLMTLGATIITISWITLYKNMKKINTKPNSLVTTGIYAHSRHPQYIGFIMIIIAWLIGWPTYLTLIFAPILIYKYIKVCKKEEQELEKENPAYKKYKKNIPFFI